MKLHFLSGVFMGRGGNFEGRNNVKSFKHLPSPSPLDKLGQATTSILAFTLNKRNLQEKVAR